MACNFIIVSIARTLAFCSRTGCIEIYSVKDLDRQIKENVGVKPAADQIWLQEHAKYNKETKEWGYSKEDSGSKKIFASVSDSKEDPHILVEESLEGERYMTQEEMLLEVFPPRSGYFRGKGNGYKGYSKQAVAAVEYQQRQH